MPDQKPYTRLRVKKLNFISLVDRGAQGEVSNVALFKRAPEGDEFEAICKVALAAEIPTGDGREPIGILFGWALAGTTDGGQTPHIDHQQDHVVVDDQLIKVAAAFMDAGSPADVMHENVQDGDSRVLFCMPLTTDTLKAFGLKSDVHGLAIGMRPSKETFEKYRSGALNAFSIAGIGERELVTKAADIKCAKCSAYMKADDKSCAKCGAQVGKAAEPMKCPECGAEMKDGVCPECGYKVEKAVWSTAEQNKLPDSSFLHIDSGGEKDDEGKTTPRSLRHFPYKDADGKVDLPHLRNAIAQIPKSDLDEKLQEKLQSKAQSILAEQEGTSEKRSPDVAKYDPDQARDDHGRFGSGGGGGSSGGGGQDKGATDRAKAATDDANKSTRHAFANPREDTHDIARDNHGRAAFAHLEAGNRAGYDEHMAQADAHRTAAKTIAANHASVQANASGSREDHVKAYMAQKDLADHLRYHQEAGNNAGKLKRAEEEASHHATMARMPRAGDAPRASSGVDSIKPRTAAPGGGQRAGTGVDSIKPRTKKRAGEVAKQVVLTSVTDGHQHQIDLNAPCSYWSSQLTTSPATSEGAEQPHSHAWVFDGTGKITIATDSGHDHTVSEVVPADVIAEAKERDEDPDDGKCAVPCAVEDEDSGAKSGPTVVVVQARAPKANSPPSEAGTSVDNEAKEHRPMSDALQILQKRHDELEKRNVFLEKFSKLTDAEKEHYNKLVGQDQDVFLNKTGLERAIEISELAKADEIIYTSPVTGETYRKSSNPRELKLQKQADEATLFARDEAKKRAETDLARKGAEVMGAFAKGMKGNLQMRFMKAVFNEFQDATDYEEAIEMLKGANAALLELGKPKGVAPKLDASEIADPNAQLHSLAKKYETEHKVSFSKAYEAVLNTDTGKALYAAADKVARA